MAPLLCAVKFDPFLSLDCVGVEDGGAIQGMEGMKFCHLATLNRISMDDLKLVNSWSRGGSISGSKVSIKVEGLMVEGAIFDGKLVPTSHDSPTYSLAPTCTMAWVPKSGKDHYSRSESIKLPMYYSNERESIVAQLDMPCSSGDQDRWLQSGTVVFINNHL